MLVAIFYVILGGGKSKRAASLSFRFFLLCQRAFFLKLYRTSHEKPRNRQRTQHSG